MKVGEGSTADHRQRALGELCRQYWLPIYSFIRRNGHSPHDAEDLTQGFFFYFLEHDDFGNLEASKSRLRSYLIGAVKHYLSNERRRAGRQKRGGQARIIPIDPLAAEGQLPLPELLDTLTPERVFDRQWALALLYGAVQSLAEKYQQEGKETLFLRLKNFVGPDARTENAAAAAEELQMNHGAVRTAIHRLRERYRECLLAAVRDTIGPDENVEDELRHLMAAFQ
ncbi:MAG: RNA polymerase subunit sigma-24 [Verrucomicrobiae bacterium]|nr:RNA polymerase subunit sigma-24 [Verrucomicrobiae bacterium]